MWRLIAVLIFVIACYNWPSSYSSTHLEIGALNESAAFSLYLCVAISFVWSSYRAIWIYGIEAILIFCAGYMKKNVADWDSLVFYYSLINETAYFLEISILITFIIIECRKCGRTQGNHFYNSLFRGGFGDNNKSNPH